MKLHGVITGCIKRKGHIAFEAEFAMGHLTCGEKAKVTLCGRRTREMGKIDAEKFNYETFNYEDAYNGVKEKISKPNIFVCGAAQIGKSSLINEILDLSGAGKAETGKAGEATTRKVHLYSSPESSINLYDSEGYEVGKEKQEYYKKEVLSFIAGQKKKYPGDMSKHIHEVWYCISAANKRYLESDKEFLGKIVAQNIPTMIILTKVDSIVEDELDELKTAIKKDFPNVSIFTYSVVMKAGEHGITEEVYKKYVQKEEIIEWAVNNLEESLQGGLLPAVKGGLREKKNFIMGKILPKYVTLAVVAVSAASFVPVPFSDSVPLMGIQIKMSMNIFKIYGIDHIKAELMGSLVQTQFISYLGKTIANQIWASIPFVGGFARAAVNVGTAATITATMGAAIALVSERYLQECVDSDGNFSVFFKEKLKDAIKWVQENSEEEIKEMVDGIVKRYSGKK